MPAKEGAPTRVIFGPQPITPEGMSRQQIRDASLASVKARMKQTEGGKRLQNKVAVITGAGPTLGIGTAAARLFAREGVRHLYLLDYSDTHLAALAEDVQKTYPSTKVTTLKADAASEDSIKSLIDRVLKEEGHLDVFFANAGVSIAPPRKPAPPGATAEDKLLEELRLSARGMGETGVEEFNELMRINALSVFLAIKHGSVAMGKICPEKGKKVPGGSIVCTASVAGMKANAGPVPYSASKAAVISLAQTTAYELVGTNIRVNAICPGLIETDMTRAAFGLARATGKVGKIGVLNPTLRQGLGFEVANLALWLASDESSYVNGQAMAVDGGLSASLPYIRPKL